MPVCLCVYGSAPDCQHGVDLPDEVAQLVHDLLQLLVLLFQLLVDLQDFSPLLGGGAALAGRAILVFGVVILHKGYQLLWRNRFHPGTVFVAFVVDEAQLAEQHREHPEMFLELPQTVLVSVGLVSDSIRQLHVPEELEDLHGPEDNVLDRLLPNATQRGRVNIPCCLGLLLQLRQGGLPAKRRH